jgi:hypothetical protein
MCNLVFVTSQQKRFRAIIKTSLGDPTEIEDCENILEILLDCKTMRP